MEGVYELIRQTQEATGQVISSILEKDYLSTIATIAASFFGAMFAFRLQQKEKDRDRRQQEIAQAGVIPPFLAVAKSGTMLPMPASALV